MNESKKMETNKEFKYCPLTPQALKNLNREQLESLVLKLQSDSACQISNIEQNANLEALQKMEHRYQVLLNSIDEAFCIVEVLFDTTGKAIDYRFLEVNSAFERRTGMSGIIGKRIKEFFPAHEDHWLEAYSTVVQTGKSLRFENTNHNNHWFDVYAFPYGKPEEHQIGILFNNITEWKLAEQKRLEIELRYRTIVETAGEGIVFVSPDGICHYANQRFADMLDCSIDEIVGHSTTDFSFSNEHTQIMQFREKLNNRNTCKGEIRIRRKDGSELWTMFNATPVFDSTGQHIANFVMHTDITDRKRMEVALRESEEQLRTANCKLMSANKELESFSYSVSHDLRNPLNNIAVMAKLLQTRNDGSIDPQGMTCIETITRSVNSMSSIIQNLLQLSQLSYSQVKRDTVCLGTIASEIITNLQYSATNRQIEVSIQDELITQADHDLIKIAMDNLIGNAWKFTSDNSIALLEVGRNIDGVYYVKDNGIGFKPEDAERIFLPFERVHLEGKYQGTGIGLSIVKRVIDFHGGRVWAESEPGKGACFYFTLP